MNKRQFNKILKLHEEGVSDQLCVAMIVEICFKADKKNFLIFTADKIVEYFKIREPATIVTWLCGGCGQDFSVHEITGPQNVVP